MLINMRTERRERKFFSLRRIQLSLLCAADERKGMRVMQWKLIDLESFYWFLHEKKNNHVGLCTHQALLMCKFRHKSGPCERENERDSRASIDAQVGRCKVRWSWLLFRLKCENFLVLRKRLIISISVNKIHEHFFALRALSRACQPWKLF